MIPALDAAKQKGVTRQAIVNAIRRGEIDAERFGRAWAIIQNQKFEAWQPNLIRQAARLKGKPSKVKKSRK